MGSSSDWQDIVTHFPEYQCLCVDLPFHGESLDFVATENAFDATSAAICILLEKLDIKTCIPIGYSMGARMALYFAHKHREKVTRLVLESGTAGLQTEQASLERVEADKGWQQRLLHANAQGEQVWKALLHDWYAQPLWKSLHTHPKIVAALSAREFAPPKQYARSLATMGTGKMPSLWHYLPDFDIPTCLITGILDTKFSEIGWQMSQQNSHFHLIHIPDAGHNVHLEAPIAYVATIKRFLA